MFISSVSHVLSDLTFSGQANVHGRQWMDGQPSPLTPVSQASLIKWHTGDNCGCHCDEEHICSGLQLAGQAGLTMAARG